MKDFSPYDILGVLTPGIALTVGIITLFPETAPVLNNKDYSLGDFGLVVLVSYVLGNLVAAFGNLLERLYWKLFGPRHTERIQQNDETVISKREVTALEEKLREAKMLSADEAITTLPAKAWLGLTRRMYGSLDAAGRTRRIEVFNTQFGMNRGIAASFLLLTILCLIHAGLQPWRIELILLACAGLALYRMHRFSRYYTAEVLRTFLAGPYPAKNKPKEDE